MHARVLQSIEFQFVLSQVIFIEGKNWNRKKYKYYILTRRKISRFDDLGAGAKESKFELDANEAG